MLKKLSFVIILAILFAGCSASAPMSKMESAEPAEGGILTGMADFAAQIPMSQELEKTAVPQEQLHQPEYFVFTTQSGTVENDENIPVLYERYCTADFSAADQVRTEWVDGVLNSIAADYDRDSTNLNTYAEEFLAENGSSYFYTHSNYQELGIARHDEAVVSLLSLSSLYSGGAHPSSIQTAYNMDLSHLRLLRLEDVIQEDRAAELAEMVDAIVSEKFAPLGETALFPEYRETIAAAMTYGSMTPYWYLNNGGLVIFFNQYELGPYAAGIIRAEVPYEQLDGILKEGYFPTKGEGHATDLVLKTASGTCKTVSVTIEPESEELLIGADGLVHQVQLSEVSWLNGTPISRKLIFSAKSMCENDVLQVIGGFDQEDRSFCIEFKNDAGEQKLYYLAPNSLNQEP